MFIYSVTSGCYAFLNQFHALNLPALSGRLMNGVMPRMGWLILETIATGSNAVFHLIALFAIGVECN